jgi:osmotically inducible lipoprotein OsmB
LSLQGVDLTLRTIIITATLATTFAISGCSTMGFSKQQTGTAAGAVVGGIVGSAVTGGSTVGTVAGAAGGAVVGNQIGKQLDKVK